MKHYEKLLEMGCFSRGELAALLGNDETAGSLLREYQKKGYVERVRHDRYTVISLETRQPVLSRYQIACGLFDDATLSNHSAFEFYGYANQVFYEVYVSTASRFDDFRYNGVAYHRLSPKPHMHIMQTGGVRVTSVEQAVVDGIADFEKLAGLEETLRCITLIPALDEEKLLCILKARANGFLWQKCGYVLSELGGMGLSPEFFQTCREQKAGSKRALMKHPSYSPVWDRTWDLYVPQSLKEIVDKGANVDDAF